MFPQPCEPKNTELLALIWDGNKAQMGWHWTNVQEKWNYDTWGQNKMNNFRFQVKWNFAKKVINYRYVTPIFEIIDYKLLLGELQMGL